MGNGFELQLYVALSIFVDSPSFRIKIRFLLLPNSFESFYYVYFEFGYL